MLPAAGSSSSSSCWLVVVAVVASRLLFSDSIIDKQCTLRVSGCRPNGLVWSVVLVGWYPSFHLSQNIA